MKIQVQISWVGQSARVVDQQQSLQRESFVHINELWELRQKNWIIFFPPPAHQVREHPSHHRGPGWEQGWQVSIIMTCSHNHYDHNLLAISVILWGSPWFSQLDIHHRSLAGTYPFNLNNGGVSLFTLCDFILLQPIVGYTESSVHNIKYPQYASCS